MVRAEDKLPRSQDPSLLVSKTQSGLLWQNSHSQSLGPPGHQPEVLEVMILLSSEPNSMAQLNPTCLFRDWRQTPRVTGWSQREPSQPSGEILNPELEFPSSLPPSFLPSKMCSPTVTIQQNLECKCVTGPVSLGKRAFAGVVICNCWEKFHSLESVPEPDKNLNYFYFPIFLNYVLMVILAKPMGEKTFGTK